MGCFDGAETYELVGTYIQRKLTIIMNMADVGLYRDDDLGIFKNILRSETERKKNSVVKMFKKYGLSIVVATKIKTVDFLMRLSTLTKIYTNLIENPIVASFTSIKTRTMPQIF